MVPWGRDWDTGQAQVAFDTHLLMTLNTFNVVGMSKFEIEFY